MVASVAEKRNRVPPIEAVIVAYSGGKDSLAVMDICARAGKRIEAFLMSFLPGMDHTAHWVRYAKTRWGVNVREFQDPGTIQYLRMGRFRPEPLKVPAITARDIESQFRAETGIEWIGYGYKAADCIDRRVMLKTWPNGLCEKWHKFAPLYDWKQGDVLAYLSRRRIEIPTAAASIMSGVGLGPRSLAWMRECWPEDYKRILKVFPFACYQAQRNEEIRERKQRDRASRRSVAGTPHPAISDQPGGIQPA